MLIKQFYNIIDSELIEIINMNIDDENITRHKENKLDQRKSYAFLIWFLEFYGQKNVYKNYITDGKYDFSCDIIFSNLDNQNQNIFYVVQSKWVKLSDNKDIDCIDSDEFGRTLNDFSTILSGNMVNTKNEKFNKKYVELLNHLEKNGKIKFIFFTLAKFNPSIDETVNSFNKNFSPNISIEIIDIERIKRDYIEFRFKKLQNKNPLDSEYSPENILIDLVIERQDNKNENKTEKKSQLNKRDFLEFEGREKAYIFLLKPKTIYELFEKFGFNLFFKNVRNPIHESNYNKRIVETLQKKPRSFWYFNNGLTAITQIMPEVGIHAKKIKLNGLQIINGAQTVYSVYIAYKNASKREKTIMDSDARITLRLIKSSDEDFNLEITKYTNSQNTLYERDFFANHEIQQRIQNESFSTKIWYEKRVNEFRIEEYKLKKINVRIVSNKEITKSYFAYFLQNPFDAILFEELYFVSHKEDKNGLYEVIFNEKTKFIDMLASYYLWDLVTYTFQLRVQQSMTVNKPIIDLFLFSFALSKTVLTKYLKKKYPNDSKDINLSLYITKAFETYEIKKLSLFLQIIRFSFQEFYSKIQIEDKNIKSKFVFKLLTSPTIYISLREEMEERDISLEEIENLEITDLLNIMNKNEYIETEREKVYNILYSGQSGH
jgi:hypothetical protein